MTPFPFMMPWLFTLTFVGFQAWWDHRTGKMPNEVNYIFILMGLVLTVLGQHWFSLILAGAWIIVGLFFPFLGMGDAKLMAGVQLMVSSWFGLPSSLIMALLTGILILLINRKFTLVRAGPYFFLSTLIMTGMAWFY